MGTSSLPILMYHHVSPSPGLVTVAPDRFRRQMTWIAEHGYHALNAAELELFLRGEWTHPRPVMITFDDGYLDNYVHAYPVLRDTGLRAVLFGITGLLGEGPARGIAEVAGQGSLPDHRKCKEIIAAGRPDDVMIRWSEVEQMMAGGSMELHSHTHTHTRWDQLCADPAEKRARLEEDLALSMRAMTTHLGHSSGHLCWPQGYFDEDYRRVAKAAGFSHLYTTLPGSVGAGDDASLLPRIVTKDKSAAWLGSRLFVYGSPTLSRWYGWLKHH